MGTKIPPPPGDFPAGEDCPACTPGVFPSGGWPKYLYVTFSGMTACPGFSPAPNGYPFRLEQTFAPCEYQLLHEYQGSEWWIHLELTLSRLRLWNQDEPGGITFWGTADPCSLAFPTNIASCPANNAEGGSAIVQVTYAPLASLLVGPYGFMSRSTTLFEQADVGLDHTLIRLADKTDHSRCYFYVDREDLPAP